MGSGAPRRTRQHDVLLVHAGQLHGVNGQAIVRGGHRALQQPLRQRHRRRARQPHLRAPRIGCARARARCPRQRSTDSTSMLLAQGIC